MPRYEDAVVELEQLERDCMSEAEDLTHLATTAPNRWKQRIYLDAARMKLEDARAARVCVLHLIKTGRDSDNT